MLYYLGELWFKVLDVYQGLQPCESTKGRDIRRIPEHVDKLLIFIHRKTKHNETICKSNTS